MPMMYCGYASEYSRAEILPRVRNDTFFFFFRLNIISQCSFSVVKITNMQFLQFYIIIRSVLANVKMAFLYNRKVGSRSLSCRFCF